MLSVDWGNMFYLFGCPSNNLRFNKFGWDPFSPYHDFEFDIWNLNETWAFQEKYIF